MSGCIAGSLRPSLALGGQPGSRRPIPGPLGRVGAAFRAAPGQSMLCRRPSLGGGSHPFLLTQFPLLQRSGSVPTALGGRRLLRGYPALGCCSSWGAEPSFPVFFPPLPLKLGRSRIGELDHQWGWMEAGLPRYQGSWEPAGFGCALCGASGSALSVCCSAVSPETPRLPQEAPDSLFPLLHGEAGQIRQASPRNEQPGSHQDPVQEIQGASREEKGTGGESASPFPVLCLCLPGSPSKTSRAQPLPGEGLIRLSTGETRAFV